MNSRSLRSLLAFVLLVFHLSVSADDTDLFVGAPPSAVDMPSVLIILDNTANWNNAFENEMAAMRTVISGLPTNRDGSAVMQLGIMLFTETGGGDSGTAGGYLRAAVRPLNQDYKEKLVRLLTRRVTNGIWEGIDKNEDKSNGGKLGYTMADAYRYFSGLDPVSGNNKNKTDYLGNTYGTDAASKAIYAMESGHALSSKAGSPYNSPVAAGSCGKNFIIYISNGAAQDNNSDTVAATNVLKAAAGGGAAGDAAAATITLDIAGSQGNVADEWARFMHKSSLGMVTYTIDVDKVTTGQGPGWSNLLWSMANVSKGKYFSVASENTGSAILKAMEDIFSEIQSVNSVFASVSLPVSVNTQGTYRNQVFIGKFRPDELGFPRWSGNLKQYKLGFIGTELKLQDADSADAINSSSGFITECARSFWTPTTMDTYWNFNPMGECLMANSRASNYPDGNIVDKGAHAFRLRAMNTRPIKTCSPVLASCTSLVDFNATNVSQADLGAATATEHTALINWASGLNVDNEGEKGTTAKRPSIHGDVVHSRPAAIDFGTLETPKVVAFYGGNDGVLRAINGNRSTNIGSTPAGGEMWAFVAPEFYKHIKRIRDNDIKIDFPGNLITSHTPLPKPYAIDGPVTAYKDDSNAWIYATMRRGGRAMYAFSASVNDPANIALKWKKGCDESGCTTGFSDIGQTWSSAKTFKVSASDTPLIIMGGGYDRCEDADPHTCGTPYAPKGNKVYVLNADTGDLLNTFTTARSVPADIFVVPDADGIAKLAYVADLGGNIYRINIGTDAPADWEMIPIARFGCDTGNSCSPNRKFMFAPDVVDNADGTYNLMIGSGDREKPVISYTGAASVANHFFMFKDKPLEPSWLSDEAAACGAAVICKTSLQSIAVDGDTPTSAQLYEKKGWYLALRPTEQVVTSALTIYGVINFSTHIPQPTVTGSCVSSLGTASVYNISSKNAAPANGTAARYREISGGGLSPSPVAGMVTLDDGTTTAFCIGCGDDSALGGGEPPVPPTAIQPKARVYWYIQK